MKKDNILIALEKLDIGGIETFVLNQTKALIKKGKKVFLLAKKGRYSKIFESLGAKIYEYEYLDCIYYEQEKIAYIKNIIEKNKISEVHIHQIPCINTIMPACIETNTPYIAYCHMASGIINDPQNNAYDYFERQYITYKKKLNMFYKYASKVIAITETIKNYSAQRYSIDKKKMIVMPNSIDLNDFKATRQVKKIKKIFLISRLSIEKKASIENGINLYMKIKEKLPNVELTIAGDGPIEETISEYIEQNNVQDVKMIGNITNVKEVMEKHDLVIAVDRCILEALSLKRLAIISGYDNLKGLVTKKNINKCIKENFCGINLNNSSYEEIIKSIINLESKDIQEITEENYKIIKEKLDINKNVYTLNNKNKMEYDKSTMIKDLYDIIKIIGESQQEYYNKAEEIWNAYTSYKERNERKFKFIRKIINFLRRKTVNKKLKV